MDAAGRGDRPGRACLEAAQELETSLAMQRGMSLTISRTKTPSGFGNSKNTIKSSKIGSKSPGNGL